MYIAPGQGQMNPWDHVVQNHKYSVPLPISRKASMTFEQFSACSAGNNIYSNNSTQSIFKVSGTGFAACFMS